jgi:hypothetical protein
MTFSNREKGSYSMSKFEATLAAVCLAAVQWCSAPTRALAEGLTADTFDKLHRELTSVKEPWQTLPWQLSLVGACKQAARENKPVYMLCRSGHPLGCV